VLLVVELSRLKVKFQAEQVPHSIRHNHIPTQADRVRDELNNVGGDGDAGVAQREEHIDAGSESAQNQTDNPGANGVGGKIYIVITDDCADLK
jgi:hypothetical protein